MHSIKRQGGTAVSTFNDGNIKRGKKDADMISFKKKRRKKEDVLLSLKNKNKTDGDAIKRPSCAPSNWNGDSNPKARAFQRVIGKHR